MTPVVLSEMETMRRVAATGCNLSRFGRCELKLAQMRSGLAQAADARLSHALRAVLKSASDHTLVCIPRLFDPWPDENKEKNYAEFAEPAVVDDLFEFVKVYGSTWVSRRDGWRDDMDEAAYWPLVRGVWRGRPVLLVAGSGKGRKAADEFLSNASSVDTLDAPERDAWAARNAILGDIKAWAGAKRRPLVYMALGATAAWLAYALGGYGIQALDLGHMCQSWAKCDMKSGEMKKVAAA